MAVAFVASANAVNLDATVSTLPVTISASTGQAIVVHVAIRAGSVTVATVVDSQGNTYTKKASVLARQETDYGQEGLDAYPMFAYTVEGEVWTTKSAGAVTSVTVTLTNGAKFEVTVATYSGVSTIGAAASSAVNPFGAPTISLTTTGANSFVSAGFACAIPLNQQITTGTLRSSVGSFTAHNGIALAVADNTVAGLAACVVAITPTNTLVISNTAFTQPLPYAVCAVEIRS